MNIANSLNSNFWYFNVNTPDIRYVCALRNRIYLNLHSSNQLDKIKAHSTIAEFHTGTRTTPLNPFSSFFNPSQMVLAKFTDLDACQTSIKKRQRSELNFSYFFLLRRFMQINCASLFFCWFVLRLSSN